MRVPMIIMLVTAWIGLSGCGQINSRARTATVSSSGGSAGDASNYTPASSSSMPTSSNTGTSTTPVSGAMSSSPPTLADGVDNSSNNLLGIGSNITFVAPFQADATLTYQWYKDGSKISGATGSEFSLSSIKSTDYGIYKVQASNSMGSAMSGAFVLTPILMLATLGSHDCGGYQCWNDAATADMVCKLRYGGQSVIYSPVAYGSSGIKWTTQFCRWTGSGWDCKSNCTSDCFALNVLGYVYCYK